ncbi:hypothetical protein [Bradyrhizobium sp.]|uniref:hypothetical protein n=1 Tax=Bradyrhizobium sp. TaxID=376 RepID=UPI002D490ADF|nr:hypothetical protein [Bradyrhizobium sp.]HZR74549.1 hypothetical protein [Bradyrhizobium sp.]
MMGYSAPGMALGLGGDALAGQLKDEEDEDRKKRLLQAAQRRALGPAGQALGLGGFGSQL